MANHDVLTSKEDYLGTKIRTGVPSQKYKDNYDAIFRQAKQEEVEDKELLQKRDTKD